MSAAAAGEWAGRGGGRTQVWDLERYNAEAKDWTYMLGGAFAPARVLKLFAPKFPEMEVTAFQATSEGPTQLVRA